MTLQNRGVLVADGAVPSNGALPLGSRLIRLEALMNKLRSRRGRNRPFAGAGIGAACA